MGCCSQTILSRQVEDAILCAARCIQGFPLGPWPSRNPLPDQPYLDTLNLGKVMLFLMNMVNFSTSGNRAGLKNTSVGTCPRQGGKGLCVCWEMLHGGPWRWEMELMAEHNVAVRAERTERGHRAMRRAQDCSADPSRVGNRAAASLLTWGRGSPLQQDTSQRFHRSSLKC